MPTTPVTITLSCIVFPGQIDGELFPGASDERLPKVYEVPPRKRLTVEAISALCQSTTSQPVDPWLATEPHRGYFQIPLTLQSEAVFGPPGDTRVANLVTRSYIEPGTKIELKARRARNAGQTVLHVTLTGVLDEV